MYEWILLDLAVAWFWVGYVTSSLLIYRKVVKHWRITTDEYDKIVAQFVSKEQDIQEELAENTRQDNTFLESSLTVLDLAQRAGQLFRNASEVKKQKILNLVISNLQLKDGKLVYNLREPFDVLLSLAETKEWLPGSDLNRRPIG